MAAALRHGLHDSTMGMDERRSPLVQAPAKGSSDCHAAYLAGRDGYAAYFAERGWLQGALVEMIRAAPGRLWLSSNDELRRETRLSLAAINRAISFSIVVRLRSTSASCRCHDPAQPGAQEAVRGRILRRTNRAETDLPVGARAMTDTTAAFEHVERDCDGPRYEPADLRLRNEDSSAGFTAIRNLSEASPSRLPTASSESRTLRKPTGFAMIRRMKTIGAGTSWMLRWYARPPSAKR